MKNTKLLRILATLPITDLRRLRELISSPYFNKNENVKRLFEFLYSHASDWESDKLEEETAFQYIFPKEPYKTKVVTKLASKLLRLVHWFIHLITEEEDKLNANINLLRFLGKQELKGDFDQHCRQVRKEFNQAPTRDSKYYYQQFLIEQEICHLHSAMSDHGTGDVNFQSTVDALDRFYLIQKLTYLCQMYNREKTVKNLQYHYVLMEELLEFIPHSPFYALPAIKIWYIALQLLKSNIEEKGTYYTSLRELLPQHHQELHSTDVRNLFIYLQNNARFIYQRKEDYYQELFELYQFQLEIGIFDNPLFLTPAIFTNIVTVALLLEKLDWVDQFLAGKGDYTLDREDNIVALCRAKLCFARKQNSEALDHLNQCYFKNIYFKLGERRLRLKVYFELDMHDTLVDAINSFRKFLSKNKDSISVLHLQANRSFVNFLNSFYGLRPGEKEKIEELRENITSPKMLPEKMWLLEKLGQF